MFPMKIFKLIFWFIIITFLTSCGNYLKRNEIKTKFDQTSNFGRFLSTKYSLKLGDNDIASKIISKSKNFSMIGFPKYIHLVSYFLKISSSIL